MHLYLALLPFDEAKSETESLSPWMPWHVLVLDQQSIWTVKRMMDGGLVKGLFDNKVRCIGPVPNRSLSTFMISPKSTVKMIGF